MLPNKITDEMIYKQIALLFAEKNNKTPDDYYKLSESAKMAFDVVNYHIASDILNRLFVICEQIRIARNIDATIHAFESIGFIVEGDYSAGDNNVGARLYSILSKSYDTIIQQCTTLCSEKLDKEEIDGIINDIIDELGPNDNVSDAEILKLCDKKLKFVTKYVTG